jgi:hypothetical protein
MNGMMSLVCLLAEGELRDSVSEVLQCPLAPGLSGPRHRQLAAFNCQLVTGQDIHAQGVGGAASGDPDRSATLQNLVDNADDEGDAEHIECVYLFPPIHLITPVCAPVKIGSRLSHGIFYLDCTLRIRKVKVVQIFR